jgi:hypothetical protein
MRCLPAVSLLVAALAAIAGPATARSAPNRLEIDVTDVRDVVTRRIDAGLVLRIVKTRSVTCDDFGWDVEVVRVPEHAESPNLLYHNALGHGPDPSQVYAWHVAEGYYPNVREIPVRGQPYVVRVELAECRVRGRAVEACFVSGTLRVSWRRVRSSGRQSGIPDEAPTGRSTVSL